ncbi:unnamed protein product [Fusarium fujikuroi]|uniref:Uncharacterized protein n=1 Tax=Fusarium fujikuroi TaxID=5127 RepID=A0A9Q9U7W2_FUSFU|nr:unnamed protein product [Fusarium fujikuroi]
MATTGISGGAIDIANVKISSEIDLTPEISTIATREIVPQAINTPQVSISRIDKLLSNQPAASAATGSALPLIRKPEATVLESVPTTPYVPYQVYMQKQPNLPKIVTQDRIYIYNNRSGFTQQAQDLYAKYATL